MKRRRLVFILLSLVLLATLIAALLFFVHPQSPTPQPQLTVASVPLACNAQTHVQGNQILDVHNRPFIPYGVQLNGILLAQINWRTDGALTHLTYDQVLAAHDFWHANTVSLQLSSKAFFDRSPYDAAYLAVVDRTVTWANQLGMNMLLILQYEGFRNSFQPLPTQDTLRFWHVLAPHYAGNTHVFFDIFNEPIPAKVIQNGDSNAQWSLWRNGGTFNGVAYVGFQQVADAIRVTGANNLIFADGIAAGESLQQLPQYLLSGCNIAYAVHPYFNATQHYTPANWDHWFGNAAATSNVPVVADEWSEYQSDRGECLSDAARVVPQFLAYLKMHHIGIIGYALFPGTLIRGWNFRDPTTFQQGSYLCVAQPHPNLSPQAQGAGQLLQQFFAANAQP